MPVFLFTAMIAGAALADDRSAAATARPQPRAAIAKPATAPIAASTATPVPALDPRSPPKWWLEQMQRPCVITGKRVSC